jgi:hypothetical protein
MFCSGQRENLQKKRQRGDDENKKEEMMMTILERRVTIGSIKHA